MPRVGTRPILRVTDAEQQSALEVRRRLGVGVDAPYYLVNPGASFGASKLWLPDRFAAAARELSAQTGLRGICLAGPGEEALAQGITEQSGGALVAAVAPIVPLDVLKPLVRDAALLLTTDTGPRHYAVAFEVPIVCVMGPTDPGFTANDLDRTVVLRHVVPCGPCHLKTCPLDHECMRAITVAEVVAACLYLLGCNKDYEPPADAIVPARGVAGPAGPDVGRFGHRRG
jgi:heptosyltransferase-2